MDKRGPHLIASLVDGTADGDLHVWHAYARLPFDAEGLSRHFLEIRAATLDAAFTVARLYHPLVKAVPKASPRLEPVKVPLIPRDKARVIAYCPPLSVNQKPPADLMPGDIDWLMELGPTKALEV